MSWLFQTDVALACISPPPMAIRSMPSAMSWVPFLTLFLSFW